MEGVVQRGTGVTVSQVGKPLAGKTGTSNEARDTWFVGFSPDLLCGVFVGFDDNASLGEKEQGATTAAPVFRDFMKEALANQPATPFRIPPGIVLVTVDPHTGQLATPGAPGTILEAFKPGTESAASTPAPAAEGTAANANTPANTQLTNGTGGLY
jgi:penicillin-binding protein 1A